MLLAIDAGNTNVVFALFEGREIKARWRIATDPRRTGDEYAVWLLQLLKIEGVDISMPGFTNTRCNLGSGSIKLVSVPVPCASKSCECKHMGKSAPSNAPFVSNSAREY